MQSEPAEQQSDQRRDDPKCKPGGHEHVHGAGRLEARRAGRRAACRVRPHSAPARIVADGSGNAQLGCAAMPPRAAARPTHADRAAPVARARSSARSARSRDEAVVAFDLAHRRFARIARLVERFQPAPYEDAFAGVTRSRNVARTVPMPSSTNAVLANVAVARRVRRPSPSPHSARSGARRSPWADVRAVPRPRPPRSARARSFAFACR